MKKRILTIAMCAALTATAALAETAKSLPAAAPKAAVSAVANGKMQSKSVVQEAAKPSAQTLEKTRNELKKQFEQRRLTERKHMYDALKLSDEQVKKAEELDAKTRAEAGKYLRKVRMEAMKLREMKTKHASIFAQWKQKAELNKAKSDAGKFFAESRKSFEAILTKEQKSAFEAYDAQKRKEMEKFKKMHKGGPKGKRGFEKMGPPPMPANGPGPKPKDPPPQLPVNPK